MSLSKSSHNSHLGFDRRLTFGSPSLDYRSKLLRLVSILTLVLTFGVSNVWGAVTTYTFTSASWTATSGGSDANWTSNTDGNSFANNGVKVLGDGSASATSPTSFTNVTKVVVTYNTNKSGGAGDITIQIGTNDEVKNSVAFSSGDGRSANYTTTFNFSPGQTGSILLTVDGTTNSLYIVSIEITTAAATKYTVSFNTGTGNPSQDDIAEESAGGGITLPNVTPTCSGDGWSFAGWKETSAVSSETTVAPTLLSAGSTFHPSGNVTLYAVYRKSYPNYTKITKQSDLTTGDNYIIVANYSSKNYVMTNSYSKSGDYGRLAGSQIDETATGVYYSAASVSSSYVFTITGSDGHWFIYNGTDKKYVDAAYESFYLTKKDEEDDWTITVFDGEWTFANNYTSNINYDGSNNIFHGDAASDLLLYKYGAYKYLSSPSCCTPLGYIKGSIL